MADQPIINVAALRGIVGKSLTPQIASRYVCAVAAELDAGPLVVTRAGRGTGRMLPDTIRSGLQAVGRDAVSVDVAATPTT